MVGICKLDPCAVGNIGENWCDAAKDNDKNKGVALVHWVALGIIVAICDILDMFPIIMSLFPSVFAYDIANLVLDAISIIIFVRILGFIPAAFAALELVDTLIIFIVSPYWPEALLAVFFIEAFPWFAAGIVAYYVIKAYCNKPAPKA